MSSENTSNEICRSGHRRDEIAAIGRVVLHAGLLQQRRIGGEARDPGCLAISTICALSAPSVNSLTLRSDNRGISPPPNNPARRPIAQLAGQHFESIVTFRLTIRHRALHTLQAMMVEIQSISDTQAHVVDARLRPAVKDLLQCDNLSWIAAKLAVSGALLYFAVSRVNFSHHRRSAEPHGTFVAVAAAIALALVQTGLSARSGGAASCWPATRHWRRRRAIRLDLIATFFNQGPAIDRRRRRRENLAARPHQGRMVEGDLLGPARSVRRHAGLTALVTRVCTGRSTDREPGRAVAHWLSSVSAGSWQARRFCHWGAGDARRDGR